MSENFPGNPWADVHSQVTLDTAGIISALNLLSYEQRTNSLILLFRSLESADWPVPPDLLKMIDARLGFDEEEDDDARQ